MELRLRQETGERAERDMIEFLMQYDPIRELKVADVKVIAFKARQLVFDALPTE